MKESILKIIAPVFLGLLILTSCGEDTQNSDSELSQAKFKVYGNCEMCEKTIEGSLNGHDGIGKADWDKETKMISVTYDPSLINEDKIKEQIAGVGYDTDSHRAKDEVYNSLPGCCQYDRP